VKYCRIIRLPHWIFKKIFKLTVYNYIAREYGTIHLGVGVYCGKMLFLSLFNCFKRASYGGYDSFIASSVSRLRGSALSVASGGFPANYPYVRSEFIAR
jgi:hypothetical protein